MDRCQKIINHPLYRDCMDRIEREEQNRIFCLHGLPHLLDTARIGYIFALERGLDIDKELFYAAALLHDSGRYNPIIDDHAEASAINAELIMPDCGFNYEEIQIVSNAIRSHRDMTAADDFGKILYEADKKSRMCFNCRAAAECYWADGKRNNSIEV